MNLREQIEQDERERVNAPTLTAAEVEAKFAHRPSVVEQLQPAPQVFACVR